MSSGQLTPSLRNCSTPVPHRVCISAYSNFSICFALVATSGWIDDSKEGKTEAGMSSSLVAHS